MNKKMLILITRILEDANDNYFSSLGTSDINDDWVAHMGKRDMNNLNVLCHDWNKSAEDDKADDLTSTNWIVINACIHYLKKL